MRLAFDIETDGLLPELTTIHSLCFADVDTGRAWSCTDHYAEYTSDLPVMTIDEGLKFLMEADEVIGHNIIDFDIPAIRKVKPWFSVSRDQITDTLILSRLIFPDMREADFQYRNTLKTKLQKEYKRERESWRKQLLQKGTEDGGGDFPEMREWVEERIKLRFPGQLIGSHSLEAWGYRLGAWKGDYSKEMKAKGLDPWANWNKDMQLYCDLDVVVTTKLLARLEAEEYANQAVTMERDFAVIISEQERNGFPFDKESAEKLQHRLMKRRAEINTQLQEAFPPITDEHTFTPKANNSKFGYVKGQPFTKKTEVKFNPSSRQHIARWLKRKYGWKPKAYTETGQPMVDESVLKKLDYPEAKLLAEYFLLDKRLGMLEGKGGKGLIPFAVLHDEGVWRIHGRVNTIGAVTRRCTHSSPNMAQIPATSAPFGHDFRALLYAPKGWKLLGWDASGLELRCFAHYMARYDGGQYTETVLSGDIHWAHAKALGLVGDDEEFDADNETHQWARNKVAKRFIYAFLYGAGAEKIGEIVAPNASATKKKAEGKRLMETFLRKVPALARLKEDIKKVVEKSGKLRAIDGGVMHIRSEHAALNTLLQSAGAISVKLATVMFYDKLTEKGLVSGKDFQIVAHVHDEVQTLVREGKEDIVGQTAIEAMQAAGEALGFKCPLGADYDVGQSWAETH